MPSPKGGGFLRDKEVRQIKNKKNRRKNKDTTFF